MSDSTGFEQHGFNALSGTLRVPSHHAAPHMSFRQTERPAPILPPRHLEFYDRSLTDADAQRLPMTASSESHRGLVLHESDLMQDTQRYSYGGYAPAPSPYMLPVERPDCFLLSSANPSSYTMEPMRSAPQYNATETSFRPPDYWTTSQSSDAVSQQGQGQSHVINAQTHNQRLTRGSSSSALESFEASLKTFTSLVQYGISPQEIEASLKRVFVETLERSPPIGQRQARSHVSIVIPFHRQ